MGRLKGISTHRKKTKKNKSTTPVVSPVSSQTSSTRSKKRTKTPNVVRETHCLKEHVFSKLNNHDNQLCNDESPNVLECSKNIQGTKSSKCVSQIGEGGSPIITRSKKRKMEDGNVNTLSTRDSNNSGHCLTSGNCISLHTPPDTKHIYSSSTIPEDMKKGNRVVRKAYIPASRKILVQNTVNYGVETSHSKYSERKENIQSPVSNVLISNTINYNNNDTAGTAHLSTPVNKVLVTNTINYDENSSHSSYESDGSSNDPSPNKENQFSSYSTRRRIIRNLKDSIKKIGSVYQQASILSELFNENDMQPVLLAANILPPKEVVANKHIVDQLLKQVHRCSNKSSRRGRLNDDQESLRTNLVAAMMWSPKDNNEELPMKRNDLLRMICSDSRISRSAGKRLINKAYNRRRTLCTLSSQEKVTSWSIITQRNGYNTQQSKLNSSLFDWIINHPHVVSSPIARDSVLVDVPCIDGTKRKERVGKLLLEISVRELHQDLMRPPPIGLKDAFCKVTKKLLISESYLRNMLPPQLRAMTFAQKQICGCECCTIMRMYHASLLKYRKTILSTQGSTSRRATRTKTHKNISLSEYELDVMENNEPKYPTPRDVISTMTCPNVSDLQLPKLKCVMGRCKECPRPSIPTLELTSNNEFAKISYGAYKYHFRCKIHGPLIGNKSDCAKCSLAVENNLLEVPEKISKRKEITLMETSIEKFHNDVYVPYLKKYKYHIFLVTLLSKNHCKKMRCDAFEENKNWFLSERDYAERLVKELDGEIQSEHFGDNSTLSIEGCILQYHLNHNKRKQASEDKSIRMDFHSHFADFSKQDAATTFEHMSKMIENHIENHGSFPKKCVILDHTDGCAKQYRSGNALYLLNVLAMKYNIVIDRAVCAPGHGKSIIDGMNAVDKHFLRRVMCMSGSTRYDDIDTRMNMFSMTQKSELSFAEECARLCSQVNRKYGVLNSEANKQRKLKLSERFYYVQDPDTVSYPNLTKKTKGWKKISNQKYNGIQHHYNFRADPVLGLGFLAVRRIPCACEACIIQLKKPWKKNLPFDKQPRYKSNNKGCILWDTLGELNNWIKIQIIDSDPSNIELESQTTKKIFKETLKSRAELLMTTIEEGNYGAIATSDDTAVSGYYICIFRSCAYFLQDNFRNQSEFISKGELVCDITWLNPVPSCSNMYSHGFKDEKSLDSIIKVQHVVDENVKFEMLQTQDILPRNMRQQFDNLKSLNTIVICEDVHDTIVETIQARNHLDYNDVIESSDNNYDSDYDSGE